MRNKDNRIVVCKLCSIEVPASGMGSHLYHKHNKLSSNEYVEKFGEFRRSKINLNERKNRSNISCQICNQSVVSHKGLMHHISIQHEISWEDYFVKYFFDGVWPVCKCGCGERVKLVRSGKPSFYREYLTGHNTKTRTPGYRSNTQQQKETMRKAAIQRMKNKKGTFYTNGPSSGEKEVQEFIKSLGINYTFNDKVLLGGLEVDILLSDHNLAIEYNGGYFHSDLFKNKNYHIKKTKELSDKGIRLVHIWEHDWYSKPEIVKSIIRNIIGRTEHKLYARNLTLREVPKAEADAFLSDNHLQGTSIDNIRLGLYDGSRLVSVMTFSKLRRAVGMRSKEGSFELVRFSNLLNHGIVGGASRLFKYFVKTYNPSYIISFANRDWSNGELYNKLGMSFKGFTTPGYFYVKSKIKYTRFQFQKHKLVEQGFDETKTEYEIMLERGFYRIWDCGNYKFEWSN